MLTIRVIRKGGEGYYLRNVEGEEDSTIGYFAGSGATILGISGAIAPEDVRLQRLFDARHPVTGQRIRKHGLTPRTYTDPRTRQTKRHNPCILYDAVINAPKAFSVLALTSTPEMKRHCLALHTLAVKMLYDTIEATCWSRTKGQIVKAHPVFVEQIHTRNRSLEPHLHSHLLILNTAPLKIGGAGALVGEKLFKLSLPLGQQYRNHLRSLVESELGRQTYPFSIKNGESFGIEGIPHSLEERFSSRGKQVREYAKTRKRETGREASGTEMRLAALRTRSPKVEGIDQVELEQSWREIAQEFMAVEMPLEMEISLD
jgi:conjugative relaxase-like TrwC/TraI family protein